MDRLLELQPMETPKRGLRLIGEVDLSTAPYLSDALAELNGDGDVTLDLSEMTFIDSSGLVVIVAFARSLEGSKVVLTNASEATRRTLQLTNLDDHPSLVVGSNGDGG
jgi:anti-sigma B factor antagonist